MLHSMMLLYESVQLKRGGYWTAVPSGLKGERPSYQGGSAKIGFELVLSGSGLRY